MDEGSFYGIVRDVISDAVEVSEPGTLILIAAEPRSFEELTLVMQQVAVAGEYVSVTVSDQGRGMNASEINDAIEPFYSVTS